MTYIDNIAPVVQRVKAARFVESAQGAAATYEWGCVVPAYAIISNIGIVAEALWDDGTSASLEVGISGGDEDEFFTAVDLKATDLLAGETVDFAKGGGVEGANLVGTGTHWENRYSTSQRTISFTVAAGGGDGTAGRTVVYVEYLVPTLESPTVA